MILVTFWNVLGGIGFIFFLVVVVTFIFNTVIGVLLFIVWIFGGFCVWVIYSSIVWERANHKHNHWNNSRANGL